jgi:cytidine diphosphoramidate kinase
LKSSLNSLKIRPGSVTWITGLSGTGKSSVASELSIKLRNHGYSPIIIDGDCIRSILPISIGYSPIERRNLAHFYSRLALELSSQGHHVICATISLFKSVHSWNRAHIPIYLEVLLHVPIGELRARDHKKIYSNSRSNTTDQIVGVGIEPEYPEFADLEIANYGTITAADSAALIFTKFIQTQHAIQ